MSRIEHIADGVTLYLGDCREILPTLPQADAVVTDPPYGIDYKPSRGTTNGWRRHWNDEDASVRGDDKPFDPSPLLSTKQCIFWGANAYAAMLPSSYGWLVWDKSPNGITGGFNYSHCELAWTNVIGRVQKFCLQWGRTARGGEQFFHPTQKPVDLMSWCLGFVHEATLICDPYLGCGATGVAAVKLGRQFIGIEIEPKYFDIACRRMTEAAKQADLFIEKPKPSKQEALL